MTSDTLNKSLSKRVLQLYYSIDIGILLSKILLRQHHYETPFVETTRQCHDNCHEVENDPPDHFYCIFK